MAAFVIRIEERHQDTDANHKSVGFSIIADMTESLKRETVSPA